MPLSEARAKIIAQIEAKILDKINDAKTNGGSFLDQAQTVTVGGQPVAIKEGGLGGALGKLTSTLDKVISVVQTAGDIAALVQNPMGLVQELADVAIGGVTDKLTAVADKLTGGQLSQLQNSLGNLGDKLDELQAHTSNLSGLSSAISDTAADFRKIQNLGETLRGMGTEKVSDFINSTASALKSQTQINDVEQKLSVVVQNKLNEISLLDNMSASGQTAISALVTDIDTLLNTQEMLWMKLLLPIIIISMRLQIALLLLRT